jgi:F420-non-reducing hydrogenase large subunit
MGMLDGKGNLAFYDGDIKVVSPDGDEFVKFRAPDYKEHIKERVDPSSYMKILYLAGVGWRGYVPGKDSGIYRVGPLARINVASGLSTPMAHSEYERMIRQFGGKPIHNTLAYHQARLVEVLYCAERMEQLIHDERIMDRKIRVIPHSIRYEGVGICEAPRGTLIHHYLTDENAIIKRVNLMVATQHNAGALTMTVERAAKLAIQGGKISEGKLNLIESLLRSYDPCLACATHCLGTPLNIQLSVRDHAGRIIKKKNI